MKPVRLTLSMLVLALILSGAPGTATAEPWQPPEPDENGWDWIRLNSGEWLGGELELLRDRELEFDSDELDMLKLDWTDVAELRSPRILTYRFDDLGNFTGPAVMRGDTVAIGTMTGVQRLPRAELLLIMQGHLRERLFDYAGNYGEVQGVETINNHNLSAGFDVLVSAGFFLTPLSVNFLRDPFTNIDLKSTVGGGVGYVIARDGTLDWSVGVGGGYQSTDYTSVPAGEDMRNETGTVTANTDVEWDLTDDLELLFDYNLQMGVPEVSNAYHHARLTLSFDILGDIIDLDLSLVWDRVESPQQDADGNVPVRDDLRTTIGIGLDI